MSDCVIVVWRLVPYHDARFSAAAKSVDFIVLELFGQNDDVAWSDGVSRAFSHRSLKVDGGSPSLQDVWTRLEKELDRLSPRIVAIQGWADPLAYKTANWALWHDAKIIVFSESNSYDHPRIRWQEWIKSRFLSVCDAAFVGGRDHLAYLDDLGFDNSRAAVGYNAVDNAHFEQAASDRPQNERPYFLIVSRLAKEKNIERAIQAYASYRRQSKTEPWDLVVLGKGPLDSQLRKLVADLRIEAQVRFEGFRQYHELPYIYHGAGALLHASTQEPWGLVVNEATAAGLPVLVSNRCGCAHELVQHGVNGFVFDPEDTAAMTRHMIAMTDGSVDRDSLSRNSLRIVADWGPERFAQGLRKSIETARNSSLQKGMLNCLLIGALARWR